MDRIAPRRARRLFRFLHLAVNGLWLGAVASCLLLVLMGSSADPAPYLAAYWLHDKIVVWVAGVVVFTALFFSLYTPWGLFRRRWVIAKWIGLAVLGLGIPFAVTPVINTLAAYSDIALATGAAADLQTAANRSSVLLAMEAALLLLLFVVSVWRPGGETHLRWEEKGIVRLGAIALTVAGVALSIALSWWLGRARATPLEVSTAAGSPDGIFTATIDWLGAEVGVEVSVRDQTVRHLRVLEQPAGHYPELATLVSRKVESAGHLDVDGVSGATTTSRAILVAASRALGTSRSPSPAQDDHPRSSRPFP